MINNVNKATRALLEDLVKIWVDGNVEDLDKLFVANPILDFSIFDGYVTLEEMKKRMVDFGRKPSYLRMEFYNDFAFAKGNMASQIAFLVFFFVDDRGEKEANLAATAQIANKFEKTADGWKFSEIRFNLDGESDFFPRLFTHGIEKWTKASDPSFISNWTGVDPKIGWHEGQSAIPSIIAEYDAPWYAVPDPDNMDEFSEEDLVKLAFYRYCFGLDENALSLYRNEYDVFTDTSHAQYFGETIYDKNSLIYFLRHEREGSPTCHHIVYFDKIDINGNVATTTAYCVAMDYLSGEMLAGKENRYKNIISARYHLKFYKSNDHWQICDLRYFAYNEEKPRGKDVFYYERDFD